MNVKMVGLLVVVVAFIGLTPVHADEGTDPRELNRVVVIIDRTRSFRQYFARAAKNVRNYLMEMSTTSQDQVYLVAMGATPELKGYFPGTFFTSGQKQTLEENLGACQDDVGTDVVEAISMAIDILNQPPAVGAKHLLIFSDGNVDDAKVGSQVTRQFRHLEEFDWDALHGIHTEWYYLGQKPNDVKSQLLKIPAVYSAVSRKDIYLWNEAESETAKPHSPAPPEVPASQRGSGISAKDVLIYGVIIAALAYLLKGRNQPAPRRRRNLQRRAN
jgi:hypothetical protein